MSNHTSGPWQSRDDQTTDGFVTIIGNIDGEILHDGPSFTYDVICVCEDEYGERLPNVAANVRLIASAPELVEAAQKAKVLIGARNDTLSEAARQSNIAQAWHLLNKAIAKALGEQS